MNNLLDISGLSVKFGSVSALSNVSIQLVTAGRLGVVGESGSGKSTMGLTVLGLLPKSAEVGGKVLFQGTPVPWENDKSMSALRGAAIGFVHQDPMSSFSPVHTIGTHLVRAYRAARPGTSAGEAKSAAIRLLDEVEISDAKTRLNHYPHEYSGGMRQRVMIAAALVGNPAVLIADEPTTALDVTTQAAMLKMMTHVVKVRGMGLVLITHDLGVVAEICEEVAVLYGGKLIQQIPLSAIKTEAHPYTQALLKARPTYGMRGKPLPTIADMLPEGWDGDA